MLAKCDCCGKRVTKTARQVRLYEHHFCSRECYFKHRKNNYVRTAGKSNMEPLRKLKKLAEMRSNGIPNNLDLKLNLLKK